jgi:hypothetical protein
MGHFTAQARLVDQGQGGGEGLVNLPSMELLQGMAGLGLGVHGHHHVEGLGESRGTILPST